MPSGLNSFFEPSYPLYKIRTSLYTKGGEFVSYNDNEDYVGLYHELPNGDYWTEAVPTDGTSFRIIPKRFDASEDVIRYNKIRQRQVSEYIQPSEVAPIIDVSDRQTGFIFRFFVQKRNAPETTIVEVDAEQYRSINRRNFPGINHLIWNNCTIKWRITGTFAEQLNINAINDAEKNFPGIAKYLKNPLEFWK